MDEIFQIGVIIYVIAIAYQVLSVVIPVSLILGIIFTVTKKKTLAIIFYLVSGILLAFVIAVFIAYTVFCSTYSLQ